MSDLMHRDGSMLYLLAHVVHLRRAKVERAKKRVLPCRRSCARRSHRRTHRARASADTVFRVGFFFGSMPMPTIPVGILGATGMVGQQFIALLANHPWFRVEWLGASQRSEGKAFRDAAAWRLASAASRRCREPVRSTPRRRAARPSWSSRASIRRSPEKSRPRSPKPGHIIVSNSRNHRMEPTVPLLIPEVNADHLALLDAQGAAHGWKGRIVTNPNCAVVVLAMALAPLRQFGLKTTMVTTLQAISGAGYPGVASWDILANVIPYIGGGEEEKVETEAKKILGSLSNGSVELPPGHRQRDDHARAGAQRPHRVDLGRPGAEAARPRRSSMPGDRSRDGPQALAAAVGAAAADRLPD